MSSTTFTSGTVIASSWLNDVNTATYTTLPTRAASGVNSDITQLTGLGANAIPYSAISGVPSATLGAFRNRLINGNMTVRQRSVLSSTIITGFATKQFGGADRWAGYSVGSGSGTAVRCANNPSFTNYSTGYAQFIDSTSLTTAFTQIHSQTIESTNTQDLNGATITVSGLVLQNSGAAGTVQINVYKFSNVGVRSLVSSSTPTALASSTTIMSPVSYTLTLGATDALYGLEIQYQYNGSIGPIASSFYLANAQVEIGSSASTFEVRPYQIELLLCYRYFYRINLSGSSNIVSTGFVKTTTTAVASIPLPMAMATAPSLLTDAAIPSYYSIWTAAGESTCSAVPVVTSTCFNAVTLTFTSSGLTAGQGCSFGSSSTSPYAVFEFIGEI